MTEEKESTRDQSTKLIIAAVAISAASLICFGCLALAWVFGDVGIEIIERFSAVILSVPL